MTPSRKLTICAGLFGLTLVLVAGAAVARSVAPLFVAWVPLVLVAWVLTRPGPDWEPSTAAPVGADGEETGTVRPAPAPAGDEGSS
jgi:hypothetical protein